VCYRATVSMRETVLGRAGLSAALLFSVEVSAAEPIITFFGPTEGCPPSDYVVRRIETLLGAEMPKKRTAEVTATQAEPGRFES
jgi:hypothetical protein